jgi:hypothetical protein
MLSYLSRIYSPDNCKERAFKAHPWHQDSDHGQGFGKEGMKLDEHDGGQ